MIYSFSSFALLNLSLYILPLRGRGKAEAALAVQIQAVRPPLLFSAIGYSNVMYCHGQCDWLQQCQYCHVHMTISQNGGACLRPECNNVVPIGLQLYGVVETLQKEDVQG